VKVGKIASKVICIDPTDLSEKFFDLHTTENGLKNCVFHKTAVGEKEELRKFYSGSSGETYSGLLESTFDDADSSRVVMPDQHTKVTTMQITTIDALFGDLERLDLMVLQINGAEYEALLGARETLKRLKPIVFATVFQADKPGSSQRQKVYDYMTGLGYERLLRSIWNDVYGFR